MEINCLYDTNNKIYWKTYIKDIITRDNVNYICDTKKLQIKANEIYNLLENFKNNTLDSTYEIHFPDYSQYKDINDKVLEIKIFIKLPSIYCNPIDKKIIYLFNQKNN